MQTNKLKDYIEKSVAKGYSVEIIKKYLLKWGYNPEDVDNAITKAGGVGVVDVDKGEKPALSWFFHGFCGFFVNSENYDIKKALRYVLYSFLVLFVVGLFAGVLGGFLGGGGLNRALALILANLSVDFLFAFAVFLFAVVFVSLYFFLFNFIFKIKIGFYSIFGVFLFSFVPYVLINSIRGSLVYNLITVYNVSIGFFDVNIFLLLLFFLFFKGISVKLGLDVKKGLIYTFVPFFTVMAILFVVFYDILQINFLFWFF